MPSGGEVPTPEFKQGDSLEYGAAGAANELMGLVAPVDTGQNDFQASTPEDRFLTSPTHRPGEPVTAGAPIGPGPDGLRGVTQSDAQVMADVLGQVNQDPNAPQVLKDFARRVAEGQ